MRLLAVSLLTIGLLGCSTDVKLKHAPVSVTGKVSQAGKPVGSMVMVFQPLGDGHVREFQLRNDGSFKGELVSGEYAYYITKQAAVNSAQPQRKLPPKYFEADLSRTVTIKPDELLAIALD